MPKTIKFNIVLNQGGNRGLDRYKDIKKYIIDNENYFDDINIYGKWNDDILKAYKQFKGPTHIKNIENVLSNTKYTFIIPIKKGWVTAKFWEMIYYNIIPFFHPYYDDMNLLDVPDILRIKSPKDLINKIELFENNDKLYNDTLKLLQDKLTPDLYDGSFLNDLIYNTMYDHLNINKTSQVKSIKSNIKISLFDI